MVIFEMIISLLPIIVTIIVSGVGLWITYKFQSFNKEIAYDRLNKELFTEFNARYDRLNDSLAVIEAYYKDFDKFKGLKEEDKEQYKKFKQDVIDFFNLCAEEYYWHQKD